MKLLVIAALVCLGGTSRAGIVFDVSAGVGVPVADGNWRANALINIVTSIRAGGEWSFARRGVVALEAVGEFIAYGKRFDNTFDFRSRHLLATRLGARFGRVEIFGRLGLGVEAGFFNPGDSGQPYVALAVVPGAGVSVRFARHGIVGFATDVAVTAAGFDTWRAVDVNLLAFIGVR